MGPAAGPNGGSRSIGAVVDRCSEGPVCVVGRLGWPTAQLAGPGRSRIGAGRRSGFGSTWRPGLCGHPVNGVTSPCDSTMRPGHAIRPCDVTMRFRPMSRSRCGEVGRGGGGGRAARTGTDPESAAEGRPRQLWRRAGSTSVAEGRLRRPWRSQTTVAEGRLRRLVAEGTGGGGKGGQAAVGRVVRRRWGGGWWGGRRCGPGRCRCGVGRSGIPGPRGRRRRRGRRGGRGCVRARSAGPSR